MIQNRKDEVFSLFFLESILLLVRPGRIERPTHSLEGCCSVRLSYRRIPVLLSDT